MLTVGTWNLENLFRPGEDGGPADQAAYEAKLAGLAEVINRLAPDALAVPRRTIRQLARERPRPGQ